MLTVIGLDIRQQCPAQSWRYDKFMAGKRCSLQSHHCDSSNATFPSQRIVKILASYQYVSVCFKHPYDATCVLAKACRAESKCCLLQ